jgi:hypothetical protein
MFVLVVMRVIAMMRVIMHVPISCRGHSLLVQMLMRIMKMHVPLPEDLPEKIIESKKKKRASGNARKPGANSVAHRRAKQSDRQTQSGRDEDVSGSGERGDRNRLGGIPLLDPSGQNEGKPMGWDRRMEKRHTETRKGNGSENGLIHECPPQKAKLTMRWGDCED